VVVALWLFLLSILAKSQAIFHSKDLSEKDKVVAVICHLRQVTYYDCLSSGTTVPPPRNQSVALLSAQ
jgi:hypothetical protein